ncbi:MAG: TolC family protein [Spirosomataceae bacterium]
MRIYLALLASLAFLTGQVSAQESFTLPEAISYALKGSPTVSNALADIQDAELQIKEIKVTGLPQINGQFQYTANVIVPTQLIAASNFDPTAPEGEVVKFKFGVPWGGQAGIGVNQLIFDATWLVGLRAADTYRQLANQGLAKAKVDIAENVSKAYYSVLVAEERMKILDLNIGRLDSIIHNTKAFFKQGFVEAIDISRLEVQRNNLLTERRKVANLVELSYQLLKFQMSYDRTRPIFLKDKLEESSVKALATLRYEEVRPENRVEYQQLETQRQLTNLNIERYQKAYLPSVFFTGSFGAGHSNTVFNPFERWFGSSALSIGVNIPIYDSGMKKVQIQRQQLSLIKLDNAMKLTKNSFELQNNQAFANMQNGLEGLEIQRRNMELANEVVRVAQLKFQQGIGSNLEITNAENDLKQAQTNYFAALYDILIAKIDLDKAQGKLNFN